MACKGDLERELKLKKLNTKYREKRAILKQKIKNQKLSNTERLNAMFDLDNLTKNSSFVRQRRRCILTGKSRGHVHRMFGLSNYSMRELVSRGEIPGITRASW